MKNYILRHIHHSLNIPETLSTALVLLLLSVQLFVFGPNGYADITTVKYGCFLAICGAYILLMFLWMLRKRDNVQLNSEAGTAQVLVMAYFVLTVISAVASEYFPNTLLGAARREGALTIGIYCAIFILLARFAWSGKWVIYCFGAAATLFSIVCILQLLRVNIFGLFPQGMDYYDAGKKYSGEFIGTLGNAGFSSAFFCLTVPALMIYVARAPERERFLLAVPCVLSLTVLMLIKVAAGILGFTAGVFLSLPFVFFKGKARRICIVAEAVFMFLLFIAVYFLEFDDGLLYQAHCILHGEVSDSFGTGRIFIWRNTFPLLKEKPLLGGGADTLSERIGVIFETEQADGSIKRAAIDAAHNEYLNIAVCQGLPALAAYLAAVISSFAHLFKSRVDDPVADALAVGMLCYCIQAFFGISMFIAAPYFWVVWALLEGRLHRLR